MKDIENQQSQNMYPYNLLIAVKGKSRRELPQKITKDLLFGVEYTLSSLDTHEQTVLRLHYSELLETQEIGVRLAIPAEQIREIELNALKKLRAPRKWNYMVYGIAGYFELYAKNKYYIGYNKGFTIGYQKGVNDLQSGSQRAGNILEQPIEILKLPTRLHNALLCRKLRYINDLLQLDKYDIYAIRGVSTASADKVARALIANGVSQSEWNHFLL